jgi:hypothetical protein
MMLIDTVDSVYRYTLSKKSFVSNKWGTFPESHRGKWWFGSYFAWLEPLETLYDAVTAEV